MSAVVVDTGVFSAPLIARRAVGQTLQDQYRRHLIGQQLVIATQTLTELHFGAEFASWGATRRTGLDALVETAAVVAPDEPMCRRFGSLRADLRRTGHPLHQDHHVGDLWIATTAIHYGLPLVAHDKVFTQCPDLELRTEI